MKKIHLRNITRYEPTILHAGEGLYLRDEKGRDWYEWRGYFQPDTTKVLYDPSTDNLVVSLTKEHGFLNPEGCSIIEIDDSEVPAEFAEDGTWSFIDGKLTQLPEIKAEVLRGVRNALLDATDILLQPFYTLKDESLTAEQLDLISNTRIRLKRLPTQTGFPDTTFELSEFFVELAVRHGFQPKWFERTANFCPIIVK